ncbi:hypothetical protein B0H19DRAFT_128220 [Mycena capillaripes]|nr:hypothetical protein B0H19DRAFT_128220 [Mycena capillaripes]
MTVPSIPTELVDAILLEVEQKETLKTCSLAGSALRYPSQRILLHSLTIDGPAICAFLEDSPHIATYITRLTINLPPRVVHPNSVIHWEVLRLLSNVRRCILSGNNYGWNDRDRAVTLPSPVLEFLARQPLRELHVMSVENIPLSSFCRLLNVAPTVFFLRVSISEESLGDFSAVNPPQAGPTVTELRLKENTQTICEVLARPQFAFYIAALHHLEISVDLKGYARANALLHTVAHTLQRVQFNCLAIDPALPVLPHPPLSVLRRLEFTLDRYDCDEEWVRPTILPLLAPTAMPVLADLVITLYCLMTDSLSTPLQGLDPGLLAALDDGLVAHPASPVITWRIQIPVGDTLFATVVRRAMSKVAAEGRFVLETYIAEQHEDGLPYAL